MDGILILDFGSQYTLLIARKLREIGVYCQVTPAYKADPAAFRGKGIILSGGPASVYDAETFNPKWFELNVPILGICYGMQLLNHSHGGKVTPAATREFGHGIIHFEGKITGPFAGMLTKLPKSQNVWLSHSDHVQDLAPHFQIVARSDNNVIAIIAHKEKPWLGVQFHPEVHHSEYGSDILKGFAQACNCTFNWQTPTIIENLCQDIRNKVPEGRILLALSGGVDSSVASALFTRAVGRERVVGIMVDHGLLRLNEADEVKQYLNDAGVDVLVIDCRELFLSRLQGVTDPESKRKIIGETFIEAFESYAKQNGPFAAFAQGTLYPDVIESGFDGAGSKVIKSHHNVGGLPARLALPLVEPFRFLFKDEVRKIGIELGLSSKVIQRHPFPGPGLGVRVIGAIDQKKVDILQQADAIFTEALVAKGFYNKVWQAGAILLPVKSVGVMGDNRTYQWTCVLRAVSAVDGMTADVFELPVAFLGDVARAIVSRVDGINRVLYDVTSKPPATIEWE